MSRGLAATPRRRRLSLTRQVALLSLIPIVALGVILARVLQAQIDARILADATQSARLIAHVGIQPSLTPAGLRDGLSPAEIRALDRRLTGPSVSHDLARIKIWNAAHTVVYSDAHGLIGRSLDPSDDLRDALAGHPHDAAIVVPMPHSETAAEVGLGRLIEVYVPLRFSAAGPPAGAFEIYLSYGPIAAAVARDKRTIALLIAVGLALLWAILYRIVAGASKRLRRQADDNDRLARSDALTGLPNRTKFIEVLADAVCDADGDGEHGVAVLMLDLDHFKDVNNTLGNANGDRVLCEVAERLVGVLPGESLVARLGADEYAVFCPRAKGVPGALETADTIQASLEAPIVIDGVALNVEASVGIAVMDDRARDPDTLLQHADAALASARARWSRVEVYSPESDRFDAERLILLGQVRGAIERREFKLVYQPTLDLASRRIVGVEALVRWQHPERGLLAPGEFVPLIEQTALVGPLSEYVIDEALRQAVAWRRLGVNVAMSVNLSVRNLLDPQLPGRVGELLRSHGIAAARLTVEVTESATMTDPARAVRVLEALRAHGVRVSVDDFGTGNASIEYLAALPADELKIDKSLVTGIVDDLRSEAIVRATVDLARSLGLRTVVEGVESAEALEHVAALGCDIAQGYHISRPLPPEQLTGVLTAAFGVGAAQLRDAAVSRALGAAPGRT
jgi:diguanylate cyclase (GGDEF)-like protein